MGLFNRKKKLSIENTKGTTFMILSKYIEECLQIGKTMEWIEKSLEDNKEFGNYTSEEIKEAINSVSNKEVKPIPKKIDIERVNIEKEIKKLPRRERKKALELWEQYQEGKILKIEGI